MKTQALILLLSLVANSQAKEYSSALTKKLDAFLKDSKAQKAKETKQSKPTQLLDFNKIYEQGQQIKVPSNLRQQLLRDSGDYGPGNGGDAQEQTLVLYPEDKINEAIDFLIPLVEKIKYDPLFVKGFVNELTKLKETRQFFLAKDVESFSLGGARFEGDYVNVVSTGAMTWAQPLAPVLLANKTLDYSIDELAFTIAQEIPHHMLKPSLRYNEEVVNTLAAHIFTGDYDIELDAKIRTKDSELLRINRTHKTHRLKRFKNLMIQNTDYYYSADSTDNGVCLSLGYQRAIPGSMKLSKNSKKSIIINLRGQPSEYKYGKTIESIICQHEFPKHTGDVVHVVKEQALYHTMSSLPFSSNANPNGVCKVLGYEKSIISGDTIKSKEISYSIKVDPNGRVNYSEDSKSIKEIVCLNEISTRRVQEVAYMISDNDLYIQGTQIGISANSNLRGLCQSYGYEKDIGHLSKDRNEKGILVNSGGKSAYITEGKNISKLFCLNKVNVKLKEVRHVLAGEDVLDPDTELPFSKNSKVNNVCKYLGYSRGLNNSDIHSKESDESLLVTESAFDISFEYEKSHQLLLCIETREINDEPIKCHTTSNGLNYSDTSYDSVVTRSEVLNQCNSDGRTDNTECSANIICDDDAIKPSFIKCDTTSNGLTFKHTSRNSTLSRKYALNRCLYDGRSNQADCHVNLKCEDDSYVAPFVTCQTSSKGLRFHDTTRSAVVSSHEALAKCQNDGRSDDGECSVNLVCDDGSYQAKWVSCKTSSNGLSYSAASRSEAWSRSNVTLQCQNDKRTSDAECVANIRCE